MIRIISVLLCVGILFCFVSCSDPAPGEISVIATKGGRKQNCAVIVKNDKQIQLNLVPTDINGLVYIKKLVPGTYYLEFQDREGKKYPAKKTVVVSPGESLVCRVDLDEEPAPETP